MKTGALSISAAAGILLFCMSSAAYAVHFVNVFTDDENMAYGDVDLDSIRKGDDGLVYYTQDLGLGSNDDKAVNCAEGISYRLGDSVQRNPGWRSDGSKLVPGSYGALIADFACRQAH